jgi:lipopolysaccharide transport system permease protein
MKLLPADANRRSMPMSLLNPIRNLRAILALFGLLCKQRELTLEMTRREFSERYAGQMLGVVWGFAHPLIFIAVYLFIFSFVFRPQTDAAEGALSHTVYLLAGLVPWLGLAEALNRGTLAITGNTNLVKQVIFPLEVLPTKAVIATFVNQLILILCVMIYAAIESGTIPWTYMLIPVLFVFQFMQMLGLAMILSALGAFARDLKDVVQVFCLINIYLMPVLYMPEWLPASLRWMLYLNPFTYQTVCYQDALYHGSIAHPWCWAVFSVMSISVLGIGYRAFSKLRLYFGNVL